MVQSEKANASVEEKEEEAGEIDRIMKEIEDLEKKMDDSGMSSDELEAEAKAAEAAQSETGSDKGKVYALRPNSVETVSSPESSMVESDAVIASDEPLVQSGSETSDNSLALKVGGCTEISLDFSRSNVVVTLRCNDEGLLIKTDQGAEFRIPFRR